MEMESICWLGLLILLMLIELATMGLTTIWFAGGALAAFLISLFGPNLPAECIAFFAVSILLLLFTRPLAVRYLNKDRIKTNAESLIGDTGIVTVPIDDLESLGQVQVRGQIWSAKSTKEGEILSVGEKVKILEIKGVKLIVEKEKE